MNSNNAQVISAFAATGTEFQQPTSLFVDILNYLYVTDTAHTRLCRIANAAPSSNSADWLVLTSTDSVAFINPYAVIVDDMGNVLLSDTGRNCIWNIPSRGTGTGAIMNPAGWSTGISYAAGMTIDDFNRIYISDGSSASLIYFVQGPYTTASAAAATSIAAASPHYIYVGGGRLFFTSSGDYTMRIYSGYGASYGHYELAPSGLPSTITSGASGLSVDPVNNLYAVYNTGTIYRWFGLNSGTGATGAATAVVPGTGTATGLDWNFSCTTTKWKNVSTINCKQCGVAMVSKQIRASENRRNSDINSFFGG